MDYDYIRKRKTMQIIAPLFIVNIILLFAVALAMTAPHIQAGCYMIGTEINGDGSIEHLMIGDCG